MSPRKKTLRKVSNPPVIKGFKPYGLESGRQNSEAIILLYDEYEALRLCDYVMFNHTQASVMMNVSRPTFTRIYASALKKIAKAFVEGSQISIECCGKIYFDSDWFHCTHCKCYFNNPKKDIEIKNCPLCGNHQIIPFNDEITTNKTINPKDFCICPDCGTHQKKQDGETCSQLICPKCNNTMERKITSDSKTVKVK